MLETPEVEVSTTQSQISGEEIGSLIDELSPILEGKPIRVVISAALAVAMIAQHPDIEPHQLVPGIQGSSQWISEYLDTIMVEPPRSIN